MGRLSGEKGCPATWRPTHEAPQKGKEDAAMTRHTQLPQLFLRPLVQSM